MGENKPWRDVRRPGRRVAAGARTVSRAGKGCSRHCRKRCTSLDRPHLAASHRISSSLPFEKLLTENESSFAYAEGNPRDC